MENQENEDLVAISDLEQDAPLPKKEFIDSEKCMGIVFGLVFYCCAIFVHAVFVGLLIAFAMFDPQEETHPLWFYIFLVATIPCAPFLYALAFILFCLGCIFALNNPNECLNACSRA